MTEQEKKKINYWYLSSDDVKKKSFKNLLDIKSEVSEAFLSRNIKSEVYSNLKIFRGENEFHCFQLFIDLKSYKYENFEKNKKFSISFVSSENKETEEIERKRTESFFQETLCDQYIFIHYFPEEVPTISGKIYPSRVITPEDIKNDSLRVNYYFENIQDNLVMINVGNFNIVSYESHRNEVAKDKIVLYKGSNPLFFDSDTIGIVRSKKETNLFLEDILIIVHQNTEELFERDLEKSIRKSLKRKPSTYFLFKGVPFEHEHLFSKVLRFFSLFSRKNSKEKNIKSLHVVLSNYVGCRKWSVKNYKEYSAEFQRFVCHLLFCQKHTKTNFKHLPVECIHFCILPFIAELDILNVMNEDCIFRNDITRMKERDETDIFNETEFKKCVRVLLQKNTVDTVFTIRQVFKSMEYIRFLFRHLETTLDPESDLERFIQVSNILLLMGKEELDQPTSTSTSVSPVKNSNNPKNDKNLCVLNKVLLSALMNLSKESSHYEETKETLKVFLRECVSILVRSIQDIAKIASRIQRIMKEKKHEVVLQEEEEEEEKENIIIQYNYPKIFSEFRLSYDLIVSLDHIWNPRLRDSLRNVLPFILEGITPNDIFRPRKILMSSLSQKNSNDVVFYRIMDVVEKWTHLNINIEERVPEIISFFNLLIRMISEKNNDLNSPKEQEVIDNNSSSSTEVSRNVRILLGILHSAFSFSDDEKVDNDLSAIFSELILLPQVEPIIQNSLKISTSLKNGKIGGINKHLFKKVKLHFYEIEISKTFFSLTTLWLKSIVNKVEVGKSNNMMIVKHFKHFDIFSHLNDHFSEVNKPSVLSNDSETSSLVELFFSLLSLESLEILDLLLEKTNLILALFQRYFTNLKRMFLGGEISEAFQHIIQTLQIFDFHSLVEQKHRKKRQSGTENNKNNSMVRMKIIKYFVNHQLFSTYVIHSFSGSPSSESSSDSSFDSSPNADCYGGVFNLTPRKTKVMCIFESIENIILKEEIDEELKRNLERLKSLVFPLHRSVADDENSSSFGLQFYDQEEHEYRKTHGNNKISFEELNFMKVSVTGNDNNSSQEGKETTRTSSWGGNMKNNETDEKKANEVNEEFVFEPIVKGFQGEDEKDEDPSWKTNDYYHQNLNNDNNDESMFNFESSAFLLRDTPNFQVETSDNRRISNQTNGNQTRNQRDIFEF